MVCTLVMGFLLLIQKKASHPRGCTSISILTFRVILALCFLAGCIADLIYSAINYDDIELASSAMIIAPGFEIFILVSELVSVFEYISSCTTCTII